MYLILFTVNVLIGLVCALILGTRKKSIVLYGHMLNGNLLPIYQNAEEEDFEISYLTMNPSYYRKLTKTHTNILSAMNVFNVVKTCRAEIIVTTHGTHSLSLILLFGRCKFVDVWHGVPFKGFDQDDFVLQRKYNSVLVSSPDMSLIYHQKLGFNKQCLKVTGYGRSDVLYRNDLDVSFIKSQLGIPTNVQKLSRLR